MRITVTIDHSLGKALKEVRIKKGLSLTNVGELLGVSRNKIANYENSSGANAQTKPFTILQLGIRYAQLLGVTEIKVKL